MTTLASLFNLAGPDLFVIFFIILLLFGAKKLPELAKGLGQAVKEFGRAKDDFEREMTTAAQPEAPKHIAEPKVAAETPAHDSHESHESHEAQVPTTKVV
jgi:sec-independent protein translocase protein TatA